MKAYFNITLFYFVTNRFFFRFRFPPKFIPILLLFYFNRHRTKLVTKYLSFSNSLLTIDFYFDFFSTRARSNTPLYSATQNKSKSLFPPFSIFFDLVFAFSRAQDRAARFVEAEIKYISSRDGVIKLVQR